MSTAPYVALATLLDRVDRRLRKDPVQPCGHCDGTGLVVTDVDGDTGYRPCHRCTPLDERGAA